MIGLTDTRERASRADWFMLLAIVALGAVLRLVGLGNLGFHGDEETMALPVLGILETGSPFLPSGMYYGRTLALLYAMAASGAIFGVSEWSLRLPSAIAGTAMIVIAFACGRRFLPPRWALFYAALIALLPVMISMSQTARMYIFFVTFMLLFAVALFRWERTGSWASYVAALASFALVLHMQDLSVFYSFLFLYPGLARQSWRMTLQGGVGTALCVGAYFLHRRFLRWLGGLGFPSYRAQVWPESGEDAAAANIPVGGLESLPWVVVLAVIAVGLAVVLAAARAAPRNTSRWVAIAAFGALAVSVVAAAISQFHVAALAWLTGAVLYLRGGGRLRWMVALGALLAAVFVAQFIFLADLGTAGGPRKILMSLLGQPNPWTYLRFASFFPLACAAYAALFAWFLVRFARGAPLPDHALLALISVFAPLFLIGFFKGHIPPRYAVASVGFLMLSAVAGLRELLQARMPWLAARPWLTSLAGIAVALLFINPVALWHNVNATHAEFRSLMDHRGADHQGAAEFVRNLDLDADDIVMAEDVLQQTYYLGKVDYWLRAFNSSSFVYAADDGLRDIYTGTRRIGTVDGLRKVLSRPGRGTVYIIGSGETLRGTDDFFARDDRYVNPEMIGLLRQSGARVVYTGRDGVTQVLEVPPQDRAGAAS